MELTEKEISIKYANIETKIPTVWATYEDAGVNLAQDICFLWDVTDGELIRVIALLELHVKGLRINQHIKPQFAFTGLYPTVMTTLNIYPAGISENYIKIMEEIMGKRNEDKRKKI
jgi:hypothetical protein